MNLKLLIKLYVILSSLQIRIRNIYFLLAHFRFLSKNSLVLQIVQQVNGASFLLVPGTQIFLHLQVLPTYFARPPRCYFTFYKIYDNINSQLDATIIILLTVSVSSTCFGR